MNTQGDATLGLLIIILLLCLYLLPWFIAANRRHSNTAAIAVLTILLGWTGVGWLGALIWSFTDNVKAAEPSPPQLVEEGRWQQITREHAMPGANKPPTTPGLMRDGTDDDILLTATNEQRFLNRRAGRYPSWIAGLAHNNPGEAHARGVRAHDRLAPGMRLDLVPEPHNPHDPAAVAIYRHGYLYGYIPAAHGWVAAALAEGTTIMAEVDRIEPSDDPESTVFVALTLTVERKAG